jgi:hypothetical protein
MSEQVESRRDNFGQKMLVPGGMPYSNINPFVWTTQSGDKVREELGRLAQTNAEAKFPLPPEKLHGVIDLTQIRNAQGQTAYDRWLEMHGQRTVGGKTLHESLAALMDGDSYKRASTIMGQGSRTYRDAHAVDLIQQRMGLYRDLTLLELEKEFPEVKEANRQLTLNKIRARFKGPEAVTPNPLIQR